MKNKSRYLKVATVAFALAWSASGGFAQSVSTSKTDIPRTLSYQGMLASQDGAPIQNGDYPITVTMYGDDQGKVVLWHDTYNAHISNGTFSIMLGSGDKPLPQGAEMNRQIWLGTSVNGLGEMRPLTPLSATPYALNVSDKAITKDKIADGAVTASKIGTEYVGSISVNGKKVTTKGKGLDIVTGPGLDASFDDVSQTLVLQGANATRKDGKGGSVMYIGGNPAGSNNDGGGGPASTNTIGGGTANLAVVGGGAGSWATISGGEANTASATHSTIGGGKNNTASGVKSTVGGGEGNTSNAAHSITGGGQNNTASGAHSSIIGGLSNTASGTRSTVGGGNANQALGTEATIGGGLSNNVNAGVTQGTIAGGSTNTVSGNNGSIGGGLNNTASGANSVVSGGKNNEASGTSSAIPGGEYLKAGSRSFGYNGDNSATLTDISGSSNVGYFGNVNMWLGNVDNTARELRFYEPNTSYTYAGTNYTSFKAGVMAANVPYVLPLAQGAASTFLQNDGLGNLSWAVGGGGLAPGTVNNSTIRWDIGSLSWVENTNLLSDIAGNTTANGDLTVNGANITTQLPTGVVHSPGPGSPLYSAPVDLATPDVVNILPIANGGTNSSAALTGNRIMVSDPGATAIVEQTATADGQLMIGDVGSGNWLPNNITSASGKITVTNGPGTIDLDYAGGYTNPGTITDNTLRWDGGLGAWVETNSLQVTAGGLIKTPLATGFVKSSGAGLQLTSQPSIVLSGADVSGVLPFARGGTNSTAFPVNTIPYSNGASLVTNANFNWTNGTASLGVKRVTSLGATYAIEAGGHVGLLNTGTASELRLFEPSGSGTNYSALRAQAQANDINYNLPAATAGAGQVLFASAVAGNTVTLGWTPAGAPSWGLAGNVLTGVEWLGSQNNFPLILKVNNTQIMKYDQVGRNIIGGDINNTIPAPATNSVIAGGGTVAAPNSINDISGAIGGGEGNTITPGGTYATISGGDHLKARSYGQNVVGVYNTPQGALTAAMMPVAAANTDALFLVGNGTAGTPSNAFRVAASGHARDFQRIGNAAAGNVNVTNGIYEDNQIVAWGAVPPAGAGVIIAPTSDFGVINAVWGMAPYPANWCIVFLKNAPGLQPNQGSVTANVSQNCGVGGANLPIPLGGVGFCTVLEPGALIGGCSGFPALPANAIAVITYGFAPAGAAVNLINVPLAFDFKVCGRAPVINP